MIMVMFVSRLIFTNNASISLTVTGSSPENGSSMRTMTGFWINALASATRFTMPPESSDGSSPSTS
jgi:hypothetical protein